MRTGHHEVRVFTFTASSDEVHTLPEGWKPFNAEYSDGVLWVYASLWVPKAKTHKSTLEALSAIASEPTAIATREAHNG